MQLTTLLINALMASLAAAGNTHNDPKACYNGSIGGKRDLEPRLSSRYAPSGTIEKRLRQTRAICLACCHGAAMFCDAACRAEFSGPGAVSLGDMSPFFVLLHRPVLTLTFVSVYRHFGLLPPARLAAKPWAQHACPIATISLIR